MVIESTTAFTINDLARISIECKACGTALELPARPQDTAPPDEQPVSPSQRFRQSVQRAAGVGCPSCGGGTTPPLLRLQSEYVNEGHGPVNEALAHLILAALEAAEIAEPDGVRVRFMLPAPPADD